MTMIIMTMFIITMIIIAIIIIIVPDHESRDCDVVLVRHIISLGKPRGVGKLERGRDGEVEVSLRVTWGQGGRDRITPKERFQVQSAA